MLTATMIGVAISLAANLFINVGLNIQKFAHSEAAERRHAAEQRRQSRVDTVEGDDDEDDDDDDAETSTFWSLRWLSGLAIQLTGESGNMVAYSFAATSIVAPLGAVGLLANIYIATCVLGERFRARDVLGSLLAGGGAALIAVWAPSNTLQMTASHMLHRIILQDRFFYLIAIAGCGFGLFGVEQCWKHHPSMLRRLAISGSFATFTIFSIKGVSLIVRDVVAQSDLSLLKTPVFLCLMPVALVSGPGQIYWLNKALAIFPASSVVPTYYVFFSLSAILVGGIVYHDFDHMKLQALGFFGLGVLSCMCGVLIINSGREDPTLDDDEDMVSDTDSIDDTFNTKDDVLPTVRRTKSSNPETQPLLIGDVTPIRRTMSLRRSDSMQSMSSFTFSPAVVPRTSSRGRGNSTYASRSASRSTSRSASRRPSGNFTETPSAP
eukprot:m.52260 g.52260  ORF g.52260 m.52260 type:complete len:437 (-) comp7361_c0_seq2:56-1366(-)